jgi:hypothetical protein
VFPTSWMDGTGTQWGNSLAGALPPIRRALSGRYPVVRPDSDKITFSLEMAVHSHLIPGKRLNIGNDQGRPLKRQRDRNHGTEIFAAPWQKAHFDLFFKASALA